MKRKHKFMILACLISVGILTNTISHFKTQFIPDLEQETTKGIQTPQYSANHSPIFIDGDDPGNNWSTIVAATGNGSADNPYQLRDLVIDGLEGDLGIKIIDSDHYAEIINCTIFNMSIGTIPILINGSSRLSIINCTVSEGSWGICVDLSSNILFEGNNCSESFWFPMIIFNSTRVIIIENRFFSAENGISLYNSSYNTVSDNYFSTNFSGITITESNHTICSNNIFATGGFNIGFNCINNSIDTTNEVGGNSVYYFENRDDLVISGTPNIGQLLLSNCMDSIIENISISDVPRPMQLVNCNKSIIRGNTLVNSLVGVSLYHSSQNLLFGNNYSLNQIGISIYEGSVDNSIEYNIIERGSLRGISIGQTCSAQIYDNWIWDYPTSIYENLMESKLYYPFNFYSAWDGSYDYDKDGLDNLMEFSLMTSPVNFDTDFDNFPDSYEVNLGTNPLDADNYPQLPPEWDLTITELLLSLNTSLSGDISQIEQIINQLGISVGDSDYDGLNDLEEIRYGTDLLCIDTDQDNLLDSFEVKIGTDPLNDDTDGDGFYDGVETSAGTNPLDPKDHPKHGPSGTAVFAIIFSIVALIGIIMIGDYISGKRIISKIEQQIRKSKEARKTKTFLSKGD